MAPYLAIEANEPVAIGIDLAHRALAAGRNRLPNPTDPSWFPQVTMPLIWAEAYAEAQALLDAAVAAARAIGDGSLFSDSLTSRAWLALRRGDLTAAESDARTLLDAADLPAPRFYRLLATGVLIETLVEQGRLEDAERALDRHHGRASAGTLPR